ncbi:hypothetical protein FDP41_007583 [Naegleria fowleri]|uniref:Uncharacterized protein n=1 Tax=Naegleria fowleri TaxID=5763 RepID=A0A6A5CDV1_NAEFO|nr:uncharacterized protein FDP41_007583 [Naegleria fowleri]KAF0983668.1 hypothetical protein FDP41_007583 [Naegleria fowleri]
MKRKFLKQLLQEQIFENLIARNMIVIPKHAKTNNNRTGEATVFRKLYGDEIFNNVNSMNVILEEYYLDYFMMPSTFYDECYNIGFCFNVEDDHLKIQNPYYWKYIHRGINSIRKIADNVSCHYHQEEEMKLLQDLFGCSNLKTLQNVGNKLFQILFENSQHVSKDLRLRERNYKDIPVSLKFELIVQEANYQIIKCFTPDGKRLFWNTRDVTTIYQYLIHNDQTEKEEKTAREMHTESRYSPLLFQILRLLMSLFIMPYDHVGKPLIDGDDVETPNKDHSSHPSDMFILTILNPIELSNICKAFLTIHQLISTLLMQESHW